MIIRYIVADIVALAAFVTAFSVGAKSQKEQWNDTVTLLIEVVIVAIGCGFVQLLTGHNPVIDLLAGLVILFRQRFLAFIALISLCLVTGLTGGPLARISPRFKRWAEEDFLQDQKQQQGYRGKRI